MFHGKVLALGALVLGVAVVGMAAPALAAGNPRLVDAVRQSDRAAIRSIVSRGGDVSAAGPDGTTALHWAAHNGDLEAVDLLIRAHAPVDARNRYGITPLWLAATNGQTAVVKALLRAGADWKIARGDSGETSLMAAARAGHVDVVRQLLAAGADPNTVDANRHQTALMWAAGEKHRDVAKALLDAGADVEAKSNGGLTPLMFAIRAGDIDGALALIDRGASVKAIAPDGTTTLGLAILNAHWELAARLLDRGADPNGIDPRGRPLHVLAFARRAQNRALSGILPRRPTGTIDSIDLAKALVAHGADINARLEWKNLNYIPTQMAIPVVSLTTYVGGTPLLVASKFADVEMVRFLLANGADANIPTIQNMTPLLAAAGIGHMPGESPETAQEALEVCKLLAAAGNDVNALVEMKGTAGQMVSNGYNGAGALHGAVMRGSTPGGTELAQWLIDNGIHLERKTAQGMTALDMARGTTLGVNFHIQPEIAAVIEKAYRVQGMAVPEFVLKEGNQLQR
jgi:ankyrin repeat protein